METKIVKQVITSDGLILRDRPRGGPPVEITVYLSYIITPKVARIKDGEYSQDEPYAWEAREFLRKLLIGKEVQYREDYKVSGNSVIAATIFLGDDDKESVNLKLVKAGLSEINRKKQLPDTEEIKILQEAEETAKAAGVGRWSNEPPKLVRTQILNELSKETADKLVNQQVAGIVEHVKDGSSFKVGVFLPLNKPKEQQTIYQLVSVNLSGVKCPPIQEEHGEEAKFFTESRLLNREVIVHVEQVQATTFVSVIGSILFNDKNIALFLLKEGLARTVDRTIGLVHGGIEKYREAERTAKSSKSRIWKNYEVQTPVRSNDSKNQFEGTVIEIVNAECIIVERKSDKEILKIWFSSIRGPKADPSKYDATKKIIPLYNVPFMFDAREFLRKKLIGKSVKVKIDYEQPKTEQYPEKVCATVFLGEVNIAVALVMKGFATVIKRNDEDQKSCAFDDLLEAESKAQKSNKGLFAKNPKVKPVKPIDVSADVNRAQFQLETLSKGAPKDAIVEYVFSSSKLKCYLPKENLLINFVISGVLVEKTGKNDENAKIVKRLVQHRDVMLAFERVDKAGNFLGTLKFELESFGLVSLAHYLVKEGLLKIRDEKDAQLLAAQNDAQSKRKGIWANYEENAADDDEEGKENEFENGVDDEKKDFVDVFEVKGLKKGVVSIIMDNALTLYIQKVEHGVALDELMSDLREELSNNPPLPGAYRPKAGDYCAAIFKEDNLWYRAKVDKVNPIEKTVEVSYIDYGNKAVVKLANEVCALPNSKYSISALPPVAQFYGLAYVHLPNDSEEVENTRLELEHRLNNGKEFLIKPEYRLLNGQEQVTLIDPETKEDVILNMVKDGFYCVEKRNIFGKNRKLTEKQFNKYKETMEKALSERVGLWRYGDIRDDD